MEGGSRSYSQHGEDVFIERLLAGRPEKLMVDVGANDGQSWSNTYYFGLRGYPLILIEPMPIYAERCRQLYAGNPDVSVVEAAISTRDDLLTFYINMDASTDELAMRSSLIRSSVPTNDIQEVQVRSRPLSSILAEADCPSSYALLSVDAEGHDLAVLETAALESYRPHVICVEQGDAWEPIADYLRGYNYRLETRLGPNGVYISD